MRTVVALQKKNTKDLKTNEGKGWSSHLRTREIPIKFQMNMKWEVIEYLQSYLKVNGSKKAFAMDWTIWGLLL